MKTNILFFMVIGIVLTLSSPVYAEVDAEVVYILNTFSFLVHGFIVMFMAAGFTMLESGLVRTKNTAAICLKNLALYSLAGVMYYVIGYALMYSDVSVSGWIGSLSLFYSASEAELALLNASEATPEQVNAVVENDYSVMSDWFFQMVFVATAASIVSGTLAERIKIFPFLIFITILTGFIYPIQGSWVWGGGWLDALGFTDFAGSTLVHSVGGWAALVGAILLGPRVDKYPESGKVHPIPGANLPLATLGVFILWLGWFGFNGGSQLALGSALDATAMAIVYVNTNLAACAGTLAAILFSKIQYNKIDLTLALNGAIAGLVSITAGPDLHNHLYALIIGGVGGILVVITVPLLDYFRIDDVVGAIPAHLVAGIWGTLCVGIFSSGDFFTQLLGILVIGVFVCACSAIVWLILHNTIGIRVTLEEELSGIDERELGMSAYPEFGSGRS